VKNIKRRIKRITGRSRGITMERMIQELSGYLRGWLAYFGIAETPTVFTDLDSWIRRRLRCAVVKHWIKSCDAKYHGVRKLGVSDMSARSFAL
jgi:RNA-directed DNA polymerase